MLWSVRTCYPRKLISKDYMSFLKLYFTRIEFLWKSAASNILLKKGEQYTILEYTLILLFVILGSVLLLSSSD